MTSILNVIKALAETFRFMSYLLDTCILSKARKTNRPDSDKLRRWLDKHPDANFFISVISIGEIQAGISKIKKRRKC